MSETFSREKGAPGTHQFAGAEDVRVTAIAGKFFDQAGRALQVADIPSSDDTTPP